MRISQQRRGYGRGYAPGFMPDYAAGNAPNSQRGRGRPRKNAGLPSQGITVAAVTQNSMFIFMCNMFVCV